MAMVGFDASVKEIQRARTQNRALSLQHNLSLDYDKIANELIEYNEKIRGIARPTSFFQASRSSRSIVGGAVAAGSKLIRQVTRAGTGVATITDWLGDDGKPVAPELSESRASICCGNGHHKTPATPDGTKCPQNMAGDLISFFTKPVADLLRTQIEERNSMKLSTSKDGQLGVCYACGCPLKLKVHVPLRFIKKHMKPTESNNLDARCWILKEQ